MPLFWIALALGLAVPVVALAQGAQDVPFLLKATCVALLAAHVVLRQEPEGWPLMVAALFLMTLGLLAVERDYSLASVLFSMSHLAFTSLFLQHIRRRRWLLLLGLAALGYAVLAIALLSLLPWPDWAPPAAVYFGFLFAAVVSAFASRFRWAGIGAMVSALGDLVAISRVRDWPHPSDNDALTWILAFSGLAIMVAGVVQGPLKSKNHG